MLPPLSCAQQGLTLLGHGLQGPGLEGRAEAGLLLQVGKDLLPALGEEANVAGEGVRVVLPALQQELQGCRLGQAVVDIIERRLGSSTG